MCCDYNNIAAGLLEKYAVSSSVVVVEVMEAALV